MEKRAQDLQRDVLRFMVFTVASARIVLLILAFDHIGGYAGLLCNIIGSPMLPGSLEDL